MNLGLGILFGIVGSLVGLGSGWLAVRLEKLERLEEEELEERAEYEATVAKEAEAAREEDQPSDEPPGWLSERYGWTWLEWGMSPALMAFAYALFSEREGLILLMVEHLLWLTIFVHIVAFDVKHRLILNRITYPTVILAIALAAITPGLEVKRALVGAVAIGGFFLLFSLISRGGIGLGDAKLGALIGAVTGVAFDSIEHLQAISAVIAAIFMGGAVALVLLVTRVRSLKDPIPYGPFLCAGAALVLYQTT